MNKNREENKCPPSNPDYLGGVTYLVSTKSPNKGRAPPKTTPLHLFLRRLQNGAANMETKAKQAAREENNKTKQTRQKKTE